MPCGLRWPKEKTGELKRLPGALSAVVVEAQDLAVERGDILRKRRRRDVAEGHVEPSVGPELHARAVVDVIGRHIVEQDDAFGQPVVHLAKAHQPRDRAARAVGGVGEVDEVVRREVRMHGETEDAAFVSREDVGEGERGLGQQRAVLIDAHAAGSLADQQAAVGREGETPGDLQAGDQRLDAEAGAVGGGEGRRREPTRRVAAPAGRISPGSAPDSAILRSQATRPAAPTRLDWPAAPAPHRSILPPGGYARWHADEAGDRRLSD